VALAALEVDSLSVPVHRFVTARQALVGLAPASLAELRPLLLRQRTAATVRALLRAGDGSRKTSRSSRGKRV
jgi:hypothetical protein